MFCHCPIRFVRVKSCFKWSRLSGAISITWKIAPGVSHSLSCKICFFSSKNRASSSLASFVTEHREGGGSFDQVMCYFPDRDYCNSVVSLKEAPFGRRSNADKLALNQPNLIIKQASTKGGMSYTRWFWKSCLAGCEEANGLTLLFLPVGRQHCAGICMYHWSLILLL